MIALYCSICMCYQNRRNNFKRTYSHVVHDAFNAFYQLVLLLFSINKPIYGILCPNRPAITTRMKWPKLKMPSLFDLYVKFSFKVSIEFLQNFRWRLLIHGIVWFSILKNIPFKQISAHRNFNSVRPDGILLAHVWEFQFNFFSLFPFVMLLWVEWVRHTCTYTFDTVRSWTACVRVTYTIQHTLYIYSMRLWPRISI